MGYVSEDRNYMGFVETIIERLFLIRFLKSFGEKR